MHRRILFGVAAWLLGAATATAGSLLAVSLLGQGITGTSGPLLTQDAVNRALASESGEPTATATPRAGGTAGTATRSRPVGPSAGASSSDTPPASPAPSTTAGSSGTGTASAGTSGTGSGTGTVLASHGGDVVASCEAGGAYLDSWSPAQGYLTGAVRRGPAATARVTFDPASGSDDGAVTLVVSCSAGTPTATTHSWGTGDE